MQLKRRTNLLLSEEDYRLLSSIATKKEKTMGQLIREAIRKTYFSMKRAEKQKISEEVKKGWKLLLNPQKKLDYKGLIDYGRK